MKVSQSIPPPPARRSWDLDTMIVGDSFFVPHADARTARSSCWGYATRNAPWRYRSERRTEDWTDEAGIVHPNTLGIRIWRTA